MNLLLALLKKASKGDSFRPQEAPDKYNDKIAQLNSDGANQYDKLSTSRINRITKTTATKTQTGS